MQSAGIDMVSAIGVAVAVFLLLLALRDIVDLFPNLLGCLWRGRENINLYNNVGMRRTRNRILLAVLPAFVMILSCYPIHPFIEGRSAGMSFLIMAGIFAGYSLCRMFCEGVFCRKSLRNSSFHCGAQVVLTFGILAAMLSFAIFGICRLIGVENNIVLHILKWGIGGIYALFLLREWQVFAAMQGKLTGILYLCALEVVPAGMLVASYYIF